MKQKHRQHIMRNMDKLIKYTSYKDLVAETVRRGLISPVMRRNIEDLNEKGHNMTEEQVQVELLRKYFVKITKRGPTAYAELMAILRSLGYSEALRILEEMDPQGSEIPFLSLSRMHSNKSTDIVDTCLSDPPVEMPSVSNVRKLLLNPFQLKLKYFFFRYRQSTMMQMVRWCPLRSPSRESSALWSSQHAFIPTT